jgi:hypothetical protein
MSQRPCDGPPPKIKPGLFSDTVHSSAEPTQQTPPADHADVEEYYQPADKAEPPTKKQIIEDILGFGIPFVRVPVSMKDAIIAGVRSSVLAEKCWAVASILLDLLNPEHAVPGVTWFVTTSELAEKTGNDRRAVAKASRTLLLLGFEVCATRKDGAKSYRFPHLAVLIEKGKELALREGRKLTRKRPKGEQICSPPLSRSAQPLAEGCTDLLNPLEQICSPPSHPLEQICSPPLSRSAQPHFGKPEEFQAVDPAFSTLQSIRAEDLLSPELMNRDSSSLRGSIRREEEAPIDLPRSSNEERMVTKLGSDPDARTAGVRISSTSGEAVKSRAAAGTEHLSPILPGLGGKFRGGNPTPPPRTSPDLPVRPVERVQPQSHPIRQAVYERAADSALAVWRTVTVGDPLKVSHWFGSKPPAAHEADALIQFASNAQIDPVLFAALAPYYLAEGQLASFSNLTKALPDLDQALSSYPPETVQRLAPMFRKAVGVIPAMGGRIRSKLPNDKLAEWTCEILNRLDRIEEYGVEEYWEARQLAWIESGEKRTNPSKPGLWDLIGYTQDPLLDAKHRPGQSKKPLHRFLGLLDDTEVTWVPAGFKLNAMHEAAASRSGRGAAKDKGTAADIEAISGTTYYTRAEKNMYVPRYHYSRSSLALRVTSENFDDFKSMFASEQEFRAWWNSDLRNASPSLDAYRRFGANASSVDGDGKMYGKDVQWRKSL